MSTSFISAATQRAVDVPSSELLAATESSLFSVVVPWDELSGPALLSIAAHLVDEWPNTLFCLCSANSVCHGWHEALTCDLFWTMLCNASGLQLQHEKLSFGSIRDLYIAFRGVSLSTPECSRGYLDTNILPRQIVYDFDLPFLSPRTPTPQQGASSTGPEPYYHMCNQACRKLSSHPDTSWAFSERGFSHHTDRVIWLSFAIESASDEIRVGFTDDREALLLRQGAARAIEPTCLVRTHEPRLPFAAWLLPLTPRLAPRVLRTAGMTYNEPHAWLYSDGSTVRGIHGGGRLLTRHTATYYSGDVVTLCLDFEADSGRGAASWFLNLGSSSTARLVYTMAGLPADAALHAAIVLDERGDTVRFCPLVGARERRRMASTCCSRTRAARC